MIKRILITLLALIVSLVVIGILFMNISPQFGAKPKPKAVQEFSKLDNHNGKIFLNAIPTTTGGSDSSDGMLKTIWEFIKGSPNRTPSKGVVEVIPVAKADLHNPSQQTRILWFGHSTFLLQTDGKNYLFDPVFSDVAAPHPWLGSKRYSGDLPIQPEQLPTIDAVFISHDHYDHLDYPSIKKLAEKTDAFFVPLGVAGHLEYWGVEAEKITEMNWWQEAELGDTKIVYTPARHFSGRGLTGQNTTLWGGWLLKAPDISLFFSGDTGYGPHFKEVFERYGAVDFALLECGQYNKNWADIHMMPEQTVQAAGDLHAKVMMPVHWGAFTLSLHDWYDPAVRSLAAANAANQAIIIPQIGELVTVSDEPKPRALWWETFSTQLEGSL